MTAGTAERGSDSCPPVWTFCWPPLRFLARRTSSGFRILRSAAALGAVCLLLLVPAGCTRPAAVSSTSTDSAPAYLSAAQALRVFGAVQIAHFSTAQGYGSPEDLKRAGLLDPEWPRVDPGRYQISCDTGPAKDWFVCTAEPLQGGDPWFRLDDSQKLRTESGRRPTAESPVFRFPQGGDPK